MDFDTNFTARRWHVIYVVARHEKRVFEELLRHEVEAYLPMRKELHRWSDRRKWVDVPLFPSYVFVKALANQQEAIYGIKSVVKFVSFNGQPCIVPDWQIEGIKRLVESYPQDIQIIEGDCRGMWGEVTSGPLMGMRGEILDMVNGKTFAIRVEGISKIIGVQVPIGCVKIINASSKTIHA
jgi:transcriptional antiterminator RfaH